MGWPITLVSSDGPPTRVGEFTLTPMSQAVIFRLPFGGVLWNRPSTVVVEQASVSQHIPVVDITRLIQLSLLGLTATIFLIQLLESWNRPARAR
jgi:hypothetical protein